MFSREYKRSLIGLACVFSVTGLFIAYRNRIFKGRSIHELYLNSSFLATGGYETTYRPKTLFDAEDIRLLVQPKADPILSGDGAGEELYTLLAPTSESKSEEMPADGKKISPITVKGSSSQLLWKDVYIKNPTSFKIDPAVIAARKKAFTLTPDKPQILIIHTHGSESYNTHGGGWYLPSDSSRSLDNTQNMVAVGAVLAKTLTEAGYNVLHSTTLYDQPTYSTSYSSALKGINAYLKKYPSIQMVIDVHRDAMSATDGTKYKLISRQNGEDCAQMMLVMGTGESGLSFPNWKDNLSFAIRLQQAILEKYPTLMRPISITRHRYNEHATPASMILEVGTDGNLLSEACTAVRYFGSVLGEVLKDY